MKLQRRPSYPKQDSFGTQGDLSDDDSSVGIPHSRVVHSNQPVNKQAEDSRSLQNRGFPPSTKPVKKHEKPKFTQTKKRKPSPPPESPSEEEKLPPPSDANAYLDILDGTADISPQNLNLRPCQVCGRKFAEDRIEKHRKACEKSKNKKPRKVFDTTKMRTQGTEVAQYVNNRPKTPEVKKVDYFFNYVIPPH